MCYEISNQSTANWFFANIFDEFLLGLNIMKENKFKVDLQEGTKKINSILHIVEARLDTTQRVHDSWDGR